MCHKQYLSGSNGFAELCSLCNRWIVGLDVWEQHCQSHLIAPQTIPIQCDPLIYGGTLGAFGYCPICLGNTELLARDRMQQFTRLDYWMSHVTKCTEELDRRSAAGCSIPWCDIPCENALSRRYHLQDVHCAQFNKGFKRSSQDVTAEEVDEIPSCKRGRKTLNNKLTAGPVDPSIPTEKYQFIDETPETTKPPNSTAVHSRAIGKLRKKQSSAKQLNSLVLTVVPPPPTANCPTDVKDDIALPMISNKVFSEVVAAPVELAPIKPVRPVSSSPTLPHSKDTEVTRDPTEEFDAVPLRILTSPMIESSTPPSDLRTGMAQECSGEHSLSTLAQAYRSGPNVSFSVEESSDLDPDVQCLDPKVVEPKVELPISYSPHGPILVSDSNSEATTTLDRCVNTSYQRPHREAKASLPPRRQLEGMNLLHQNAFSEIHKHQAELHHAAELEWVRRGYPRIGWRRLDARIRKFLPALGGILDGEISSPFLTQTKLARERKVPQTNGNGNGEAGYYGPRGSQIM
jgi:hypothetical protein